MLRAPEYVARPIVWMPELLALMTAHEHTSYTLGFRLHLRTIYGVSQVVSTVLVNILERVPFLWLKMLMRMLREL